MLTVIFYNSETDKQQENCWWVEVNADKVAKFADYFSPANDPIITKAEYDSNRMQYFYKGKFWNSIVFSYD